ncbi:hypothetical protein IU469_14295 [Nocardia puris]|uniref:hypothetical protein n=1 Tax=Nocardia puris TaxID=208602 RepID=UPI0018945066|nr:hypothetical protein [Nocardia puris]MBF6366886.1 hypothetical protein [Nocardia puris]
MKDTRTHDEDGVITPGAELSGNDYVVVRLREGDDPPARILLVRNPSRCHHRYTSASSAPTVGNSTTTWTTS